MGDGMFWPGSGSDASGSTSFGYFDDDVEFQSDAPKVAKWVCRRLGYPIMEIELSDYQIYDCFEQAILEYSSQVNEFNLRENMMAIQGMPVSQSITHTLVNSTSLPYVIEISEQYGTEAGSGGNVDWKRGYIDTEDGKQSYDIQSLWADVSESGSRIEIRRVFHDRIPAISRGGFGFGDASMGPSDGMNYLMGEFGWAGFDGGLNGTIGGGTIGQLLIMPVYETLLRIQAIEFNDTVRRSQYSFEIHNNKIRFMPIPRGERIYFDYIVKKDKFTHSGGDTGRVSDFSNAPYTNMTYSNINDVGKQWIRKMTLTLTKETLGRVLSKYEQLPIPGGDVRLDGETLRREAVDEKTVLYEQLRESLEESGRSRQMEKMSESEGRMKEMLGNVPLLLYIG